MDNSVTLAGKIIHDPVTTKTGKDGVYCRFTLGISRTWKDRVSKVEKNYTSYHEIIAYRTLAENVAVSCQKDDSVIVVGRLNTRKGLNGDGVIHEVVADHVGLNLSDCAIPLDE